MRINDAIEWGLCLVELYGYAITRKVDVLYLTAQAVRDGILTPLEARWMCTCSVYVWGAC